LDLRDLIERNRNVETVLDLHDEIEDRHGVQPQPSHNLCLGRNSDVSGNPASEQPDDFPLDLAGVVGQVSTSSRVSGPQASAAPGTSTQCRGNPPPDR